MSPRRTAALTALAIAAAGVMAQEPPELVGTIDTRRMFLDHRLELARREWARLSANDSLECRNCHSSVAMDLSRQSPRAAGIHTGYLLSGERTCIDCHKGIAHELPDMSGVAPGWTVPAALQGALQPGLTPTEEQGTREVMSQPSE